MTKRDRPANRSLPLVLTAAVLGGSGAIPSAGSDEAPPYTEHGDLLYYLEKPGLKRRIDTPADWQIRRQHILSHLQAVMGPLPEAAEKIPLEVRVLGEARVGQLIRRKIAYHADSPDRAVLAYLFQPAPPDGKASPGDKLPAILCLHQTTKIGKDEPSGLGGNPRMHYALELARRGFITLAPDYPSLGESEYDFHPKHGYHSGTMKAIWDNVRAIDLLQSLPEVDSQRIGCMGHSLGGHNAMFTAAFEPRIKVVVSSCGFSSFLKDDVSSWSGSRYMPRISSRFGNDANRVPFDFTEIVGSLAPRPFLACAPLHDSDFDVEGVKDCLTAARPIYKLYSKPDNLAAEFPVAGHDFPDETRSAAYEFLERHLRIR